MYGSRYYNSRYYEARYWNATGAAAAQSRRYLALRRIAAQKYLVLHWTPS